ncbi:MAG TPA: GAF domain-containing protein [Jatrophihabitans sp.]|jgi:PAS domain S-box-containing protein|uniref:GAF domain-containing protein n=1 Tax=Jatrophihabitans sp. TaxID=1932789 RepID=UPI002DF893F1|nr:GAF domain-containing protein [Jatrophihabitans sp.]
MSPPEGGDDALLTGAVRSLLDASPNGVLAVNTLGDIRYVNARLARIFGYRPDDLVGQSLDILLEESVVPRHRVLRAEYLHDPRPRPMGVLNATGRRSDGSIVPLDISLTPVEIGAQRWVVAAVIDISARQAAAARVAALTRIHRTIAETNHAIVHSADADELFSELCRIIVESGGLLGAWIGRADAEGRVVVDACAGAVPEYIAALDIRLDPASPLGQGPTAVALRENRSCYCNDFQQDPRTAPWHAAAERYGINAAATVPLCVDGRPSAVLTLYSAIPDLFDDELRALFDGTGRDVSYALDGFRAVAELETATRERNALLKRVVDSQDAERAKIAGDVHDDSVQSLAAVDLRLGLLQRRIAEAAPQLVDDVVAVKRVVTGASERLRELLFDLEPAPDDLDLVDALRSMAAHIFEGGATSWTVDSVGDPDLPQPARAQALRIAKEAMSNARAHAHAAAVTIGVLRVGDAVEITVADDGNASDPGTFVSAPGHRGLATMRDRAGMTGGRLAIEARPGGGTIVRCRIPVTGDCTPAAGG